MKSEKQTLQSIEMLMLEEVLQAVTSFNSPSGLKTENIYTYTTNIFRNSLLSPSAITLFFSTFTFL